MLQKILTWENPWTWVLIITIALLFYFLVLVRIVRKLWHFPIPSAFTNLIDNPIRRRIQKPAVVCNRLGLEPGMTVVEIGPGKGSYTVEIAKKVFPGKVIACDISESIVEKINARAKKECITNLEARIENAHAFTFPNGMFDRIFMNACLPEIPDPVKVLKECNRIIKPDGLVCTCELFPDPDYPLRSTEKKWAREAGLEVEAEFGNFFLYQFCFRKSQ